MKSKKVAIVASLLLITLAVVMMLCAGRSKTYAAIIENIGIGVLSSGFVTLVITLSEYFVCKRKALENYYSEALKIATCLRQISYCWTGEESDLLAKHDASVVWNNLLQVEDSPPFCETRKQLVNWYIEKSILQSSFAELTQEQMEEVVNLRMRRLKKSVDKALESFLRIDSITCDGVENAYGEIDFIFANKKLRTWIYKSIHEPMRAKLKEIREENYHFKLYTSGESKNLGAILIEIDKLNQGLFRQAISVTDGNEQINIYADFADKIDDLLEELRAKIYGSKPNLTPHKSVCGSWG